MCYQSRQEEQLAKTAPTLWAKSHLKQDTSTESVNDVEIKDY